MPQIAVENLVKTFRVARRDPGLLGAVRGLARREYRTVRALDGVSFEIEQGELVGYIGPNGAGKSTTIKTLSGILVPDSGRCEVLGMVPWRDRERYVGNIGVVFGQRTQLWWDLPVIESFDLLRAIYRCDATEHRRIRDQLIDLMQLEPLLDVPVRQLSLGQRMRRLVPMCEQGWRVECRELASRLFGAADAVSRSPKQCLTLLGEPLCVRCRQERALVEEV